MSKTVYSRRRRDLMNMMAGGIAVIPTAPEQLRNGDVLYRYRADSDFYYLCGFPEPEAVVVMVPGRAQGEFLLFCRENDVTKELWNGRRSGLTGAVEDYGADDAFPIDDIDDILPGLMENRDKIFCAMGRYTDFDKRLIHWLNEVRSKVRTGIHAPAELVDIGHILHELRLLKSGAEIGLMKQAAQASVKAHRRAMKKMPSRPVRVPN